MVTVAVVPARNTEESASHAAVSPVVVSGMVLRSIVRGLVIQVRVDGRMLIVRHRQVVGVMVSGLTVLSSVCQFRMVSGMRPRAVPESVRGLSRPREYGSRGNCRNCKCKTFHVNLLQNLGREVRLPGVLGSLRAVVDLESPNSICRHRLRDFERAWLQLRCHQNYNGVAQSETGP